MRVEVERYPDLLMEPGILKLTLDTNCLINHFDAASETATSTEDIAALIRLATSGKVEIALTTRAEADLEQDRDTDRRARMLAALNMFEIIGSVLRWGESKWKSDDVWADGRTIALSTEIQRVLFPGLTKEDRRYGNKIRDVDHVLGHIVGQRDVFVTDDGRLNQRAADLARLGAVIMRPSACLTYVERSLRLPDELPSLISTTAEGFSSSGLLGEVAFDYSSDDGCFVFGDGALAFETRWSSASETSVHAYRDAASINAIALAYDVSEIHEVRDASKYDFSSRARTPRVGEIVIWQNRNALFAATKIVEVQCRGRNGAMRDLLRFQYVILSEGSDFSRS